MLQKFLDYNKENKLFKPDDKILLAVSGGIDSVAMANLFNRARLKFGIAHCNFGLRGEASDADEHFVKKLSKKYKVTFHSNQFDTEHFAQSEKISTQMAARHLRYEWFNKLLKEEGYALVATAHHQNDILETVLLNLVKGTGIAGLHGIKPKNGNIIRPILFADKNMIQDYVAVQHLTWREDSSNESAKYQRNIIRHEIVPKLKLINLNVVYTIKNTVERISAVEQLFNHHVGRIKEKAVLVKDEDAYIDIAEISASVMPAIILSEIIKPYHFNYHQAKNIAKKLGEGPGKVFESPTHRLNIDREKIIISPKDLSFFQEAIIQEGQTLFNHRGLNLRFSILVNKAFKIPADKNIAVLDYSKLKFPLKVRKWKEGDWFYPLGMNRKKKLSDFMIDEKIPLNLKARVFVITSGDSICWVVGNRIDNRFKVTGKTRKIYKITSTTGND